MLSLLKNVVKEDTQSSKCSLWRACVIKTGLPIDESNLY